MTKPQNKSLEPDQNARCTCVLALQKVVPGVFK